MRIRPFAALSLAAASALILVGCASGASTADPSATETAGADLCAAAAPSGEASEAVTVEGEFGVDSTATFEAPLEISELQRTVVTEGSGDPVEAGELVSYALTAFSAESGEKLGTIGYGDDPALPAQISPDSPIGQVLGCATPGTRVVATFPATDAGDGEVYIFDFFDVVPQAAWGEPQEPVEGMPTVELDETGAPTITIPEGQEAPTETQVANLKNGDGATVASGDGVLVHYTGVKWSDGTVFDSSWESGTPASFQTTGVVAGFQQALEGQKVGSQVLVVMPPKDGYGATDGHELQEETLVFVVDILGVQHIATTE